MNDTTATQRKLTSRAGFQLAHPPRCAKVITLLTAALILVGLGPVSAAEIRYPDVLYLDELKHAPVELKTIERTPLSFSRDPRSVMAFLAKGQPVTVLGFGETNNYVSCRISTGPAKGWVRADALAEPAKELMDDLRARHKRMLEHRKLIEKHEVALTMTHEEVLASLGRPDRKARMRSQAGDEEEWYYMTYRSVPYYHTYRDENGELRRMVYYRKVATGQRVIAFRGDEVIAINDDQSTTPPPPDVMVVPPPGVPMVVP